MRTDCLPFLSLLFYSKCVEGTIARVGPGPIVYRSLVYYSILMFRRNDTSGSKHREDRFHLNNLSFAGPVVMGVGGTIK
jgi:hypothetical protein